VAYHRVWISRPARCSGTTGGDPIACSPSWRIRHSSAATVSYSKQVIVGVQDLCIAAAIPRGIENGSRTTSGAYVDRQNLARLHGQECSGVSAATSASSAIAMGDRSASACTVKINADAADSRRYDKSSTDQKLLTAIQPSSRANRSSGPLRSGRP